MTNVFQRSPGTMGPSAPMVGRAAERVLLNEQLSATLAGHGNVVIVGGEAGIGKTTLVRELDAHARASGCLALSGHCYDLMAASPYGVWIDFAERYRHIATSGDLPPLPPVLEGRTLETITTQSAFFSDVVEFLGVLTARQPAVITLEDVHWADLTSLELLRHIAARVKHMTLLLMVTYREDELTRQNPFYQQLPSLVHESEGLRLDLKRLSNEDLDALAAQEYGLSEADRARLVTYLADHAEGNPFFTVEVLRALEQQEVGGLNCVDGIWLLAELDHVIVPSLVRQVIDARVSRLGESIRSLLTVAAVIGHEVPLDLLASMTEMPVDELYDGIDKAIEWHLLIATPEGRGVQFVHALTREALYASMPQHRRRVLHQAVAEALETVPDVDTEAVAYHYRQAGDPRAPDWLTKAGDRAQRAYAWDTARDRFAMAAGLLESVPGAEGDRARLLYRCGRLQRYSNAPAAIESLQTAARLAEVSGDTVLAADATYSHGLVQCFADEWLPGLANMIRGVNTLESLPSDKAYVSWATANWMADALPIIEQPSDSANSSPDTLTAVGPNRHRSLPWFMAVPGRLQEAQKLAESFRNDFAEANTGALALANAGHAEFGLGTALAALGFPDEASAAFEGARQLYLQVDHHACIAFVDLTELLDYMIPYRTNDVAGRLRLAKEAEIGIDRARGAIASEVTPLRAQLMTMYLDGRWNEARRIGAECRVHGAYILRRPVTNTMAQIAYHQGDTEETWSYILTLLPLGPDTEPGTAVLLDALMLQQLAVRICLDAGNIVDADRWLDANDRWLAWSGSVLGWAENHHIWAMRYRAAGEPDAASERIDKAIEAANSPCQPLALLRARRFKGELALERNDRKIAEQELTASMELATTCEIAFERAESLLALARLRSANDPPSAADMAREALGIGQSLGAQPLCARTDVLLGDLAESSLPGDALPTGLTARELDVLRLVSQGMTNAEIGDALFISSRTVGQHLRSIYGKLEVRSRTEATRFAMDHGLV